MSLAELYKRFQLAVFKSDYMNWEEEAIGLYKDYFYVFLIGVLIYPPTIFGIQYLMKDRKPFNFRGLLAVWNLGLALFSILGTVFTLPFLVVSVSEKGFFGMLCDPHTCTSDPSARWVLWFCVSKIVEFGDTIFIVLHKRPLIFLHWYHHVMTMLYCWYAVRIGSSYTCAGWWFAIMNLIIHSVMYSYYFITTLGYKPSWNKLITMCQIFQMVAGLLVILLTLRCPASITEDLYGTAFGIAMYLSYFLLFSLFYYDKYIKAQDTNGNKKTSNGNTKGNRSTKTKKAD